MLRIWKRVAKKVYTWSHSREAIISIRFCKHLAKSILVMEINMLVNLKMDNLMVEASCYVLLKWNGYMANLKQIN